MSVIKCAVYVRKSTEHGLEQEFNSLLNQDESCKAYIASQAFNNWEYVRTYTDAAISGGTMERPALKQMLDDISKGLINTVVVYKVDRLSRSILDFHNMMKYFDKYNCNFVSITQAFDTSTSMGKLTLNMLLSFAQFEREVASERVRDKIRASKAKGLWMGGNPPLGYDIKDKKLVINEAEAQQVKQLFEKYLELQSVKRLVQYAEAQGIYSKKWISKKGNQKGGNKISLMGMHRLLRDMIYIGQIAHKKANTTAKGEQDAIISKELFNEVQQALKNNSNNKTESHRSPNLLSGKLFNSQGERFINQVKTNKNHTKIHYYAQKGLFIPAAPVDEVVSNTISEFLNADLSHLPPDSASALKSVNWAALSGVQKRDFIQAIVDKAIFSNKQLIIYLDVSPNSVRPFITDVYVNQSSLPMEFITNEHSVTITVPVVFRRYTNTKFSEAKTSLLTITENNNLIVKAFATAWRYREMYEKCGDVDSIGRAEHVALRHVYKHLSLVYLNPEVVNHILSNQCQISVRDMLDKASRSNDFAEQKKLFAAHL